MLRAGMPQAVLWGIRFSQKMTKLLMDDFYDIPQLFDEKKIFQRPLHG